ncbi:HIT family protein [Gordonia sp. VNQ95]|uniref:HIT family protein n=1 Tax=Gordonia TaxID=2053 RepID=UPI0032B612CD
MTCIFCAIVTGDAPSATIAEDDSTLAFLDINPATEGHLLVIPKRHSTDLLDISTDDLTAVTLTAQRIARVAIEVLGADGVNLLNCCGADAWQTVFHFHLHVVPRYADPARDRLTLPWRPGQGSDPDVLVTLGRRLSAAL